MMKRLAVCAFAAVFAGGCEQGTPLDGGAALTATRGVDNAADAATRTYEVTITNLTSGQPLSPGIIATHAGQVSIFSVGATASEGIRLIAENGDPGMAVSDADGTAGVDDAVATMQPVGCVDCPGPFGSELTVMVGARANANKLSLALMLICTNDGFIGLDGVALPVGRQAVTYDAFAYDAGTEANDETWATVVDPCGAIGPVEGPLDDTNDRNATEDVIAPHPGIAEAGDLTADHAWDEPVARVTVRRVS